MKKVLVERKIENVWEGDKLVSYSILREREISKKMEEAIKSENVWDVIDLHSEIGCDAYAVCIDGDWFAVDMFHGNDEVKRINERRGTQYPDHWELPPEVTREQGPYGGAFSSWKDYYAHKGVKTDKY